VFSRVAGRAVLWSESGARAGPADGWLFLSSPTFLRLLFGLRLI
jgi:hypothetical protein